MTLPPALPAIKPAGYILTGMRRLRARAHPPMILFHSLTSDFFGMEEREAYFPDFDCFSVFAVTARVLRHCRRTDHMAGQTCIDEFGYWRPPGATSGILCTREEARRAWHAAKQAPALLRESCPP